MLKIRGMSTVNPTFLFGLAKYPRAAWPRAAENDLAHQQLTPS